MLKSKSIMDNCTFWSHPNNTGQEEKQWVANRPIDRDTVQQRINELLAIVICELSNITSH